MSIEDKILEHIEALPKGELLLPVDLYAASYQECRKMVLQYRKSELFS